MTRAQLFSKMPEIKGSYNKITLLTHTDLDGAGATVLMKLAFQETDVEVVHCSNNTMSADILEILCRRHNFPELYSDSLVIATDISLTQKDAEIAASLVDNDFLLFDHHLTAEHMNTYDWACVYGGKIEDSPRTTKFDLYDDWHTSATALLYEYFAFHRNIDIINNLDALRFTHMVSAYDTWDWKTTKCDKDGIEKLNSLCYIYGLEEFEKEFVHRILKHAAFFTDVDELVLRIDAQRAQTYVNKVTKSVIEGKITIDDKSYTYAACISTDYNMQVFQYLRTSYPDKDILIINAGDSISMRTDKEDINLGRIAGIYAGGGHPAAAGIPVSYEQKAQMIELPFSSEAHAQFTSYFN